jgi:hypothetical protein
LNIHHQFLLRFICFNPFHIHGAIIFIPVFLLRSGWDSWGAGADDGFGDAPDKNAASKADLMKQKREQRKQEMEKKRAAKVDARIRINYNVLAKAAACAMVCGWPPLAGFLASRGLLSSG